MSTSASELHDRASIDRYLDVRRRSTTLVEPLSAEDACVQSMPDASPAKWHLAHTTWFFETFVLAAARPGHRPFDDAFRILFNSYYNAVGEQYSRPDRGLLTRPSLATVLDYRAFVDEAMVAVLDATPDTAIAGVIEIGLHHEQQHQELLLMDMKHLLSRNPIAPAYHHPNPHVNATPAPLDFVEIAGGIVRVGAPDGVFSFDNERPRHDCLVPDFVLGSRAVTNGEYLEFIRDGGYESPLLWLSDGWTAIRQHGWRAPLYWRENDGEMLEFTLGGTEALDLAAPAVHVSYYEADAYARWAGARLPTEQEWEVAATAVTPDGNFVESGKLHPRAATSRPGTRLQQMFGDVWEWTMSPYSPYPGFETPPGAIGEYNGKFMSGQMVLRGGCCATPASHIRASYRNFFYPANRWQFGGIRLARNAN